MTKKGNFGAAYKTLQISHKCKIFKKITAIIKNKNN